MPHDRKRHALAETLRKLKFSRIVTIQGPRQCGKSFFARNLLCKAVPEYEYQTLDVKAQRQFAQENPSTFLDQYLQFKTLALDEAQKAPDLFDEIKSKVDSNPRPGQYLLLGSTEFSREVRVKESLTGRVSRLRMFPLNAAEISELPLNASVGKDETHPFQKKPRIQRVDMMKVIQRGGFPGVFGVRDVGERSNKLQEWVEVTAFRDLNQFKDIQTDPELTIEIMEAIATLDFTGTSEIRSKLKKDLRVIKKHLVALTNLFAVSRLSAHVLGTGIDQYYLCDPALVLQLGGSFEKALETWVYLELQSQASYQGRLGIHRKVNFYRSSKRSVVHFVIQTSKRILLLYIHPSETWKDQDTRGLRACLDKFKSEFSSFEIDAVFLYGGSEAIQWEGIRFLPWEAIA